MVLEKDRRVFLKCGVVGGAEIALCGFCFCGGFGCRKKESAVDKKKADKEDKKVEEMIAFCGLICNSDCPAFIATQKDDDEAREKVARRWSSERYPLRPEDINCDGCLVVDGRLLSFCRDCEARRCGLEKGVKNCAYCSDYPCEKLDDMHRQAPKAKLRLDEIRKSL